MALLQISEPGQAPDPHQRRVAVGIDLGTTHSLVAAVRHGVAECLPDDQGRVLIPALPSSLVEEQFLCFDTASGQLGRCPAIPAGATGPTSSRWAATNSAIPIRASPLTRPTPMS